MNLKILIVEDHTANRVAIRRRLERRGYTVVEAEDGAVGVDKFKSERPDLILMDISMPNMSGIDALTAIRSTVGGRTLPVVALTAHAMESMRSKCEEIGFDAFLSKPLDFDALLAMIETLALKRNAA